MSIRDIAFPSGIIKYRNGFVLDYKECIGNKVTAVKNIFMDTTVVGIVKSFFVMIIPPSHVHANYRRSLTNIISERINSSRPSLLYLSAVLEGIEGAQTESEK